MGLKPIFMKNEEKCIGKYKKKCKQTAKKWTCYATLRTKAFINSKEKFYTYTTQKKATIMYLKIIVLNG